MGGGGGTVTGCGIDELHPATGIFSNIAYLFTLISQTRVLQTKYQNTHKYLNLNQTKLIYSKVNTKGMYKCDIRVIQTQSINIIVRQ